MKSLITFRWIGRTALWALISCAMVSFIWEPSFEAIGITAVISIAISLLFGNGARS